MNPTSVRLFRGAAVALLLSTAHVTDARQPSSMPEPASWRSECGSCHVPYAARFLSADDWRAVMSRLEHHYGDDASVDAAVAADIGRYLEANAGRRPGGDDNGLPRITTGRWFAKEHREVAPSTWSAPGVKSRSNCAACHRNAAQGDFDDDDVRIPR